MTEPIPLTLERLVNNAIAECELDEHRDYIGASIIATECERALWYGFRWAKLPGFPPRIRRRFKTGDTYEDRVAFRLEQTGRFRVTTKNPRARNDKQQYRFEYGPLGGLLAGHTDGWCEADTDTWLELGVPESMALAIDKDPVLLEIKALVSAKYHYAADDHEYLHPLKNKSSGTVEGRWFGLRRKGVLKSQKEHFGQAQAYMGMSDTVDRSGALQWKKFGLPGPLKWAMYVGVNTDTDQIYAELVPFSPKWWDAIVGRAWRVVRATTPPPRCSDNPASWVCRFCFALDICHGTDKPDLNCRTCLHSQLKIPGDPKFFGNTAVWFCSLHSQGCGDFTACSQHTHIIDDGDMF